MSSEGLVCSVCGDAQSKKLLFTNGLAIFCAPCFPHDDMSYKKVMWIKLITN